MGRRAREAMWAGRGRFRAMAQAGLIVALALCTFSGVAAPSANPNGRIEWRGQQATMQASPGGGFVLRGPFGERAIPAPARTVRTASPMFDGLFAMAQDDLALDSVTSIQDGAFDHGQPMPCHCFETGEKWPYVWTRDLSYSTDLGLWRFDPERARNGLLFKLSGVRAKDVAQGLYPMQDTGSGGSWPVSTDRIVWFLGARHLLGDKAFADKVWQALNDTLAQDREYVFDPAMGLYRGETSFLDWREQTYPEWTRDNVVFIAQSFALSTNVLHYDALRLAAKLAAQRGDARAKDYSAQAVALKHAINAHFWRAGRGMYMSYIGGDGLPVEAYDLLGISLAITSGVADPQRAREILANYPVWPAGSPVIWPERADQPIYHNRAIWPFVSAYALRAARKVDDPALIAFEIESLMRGAALSGSDMENFSLVTQSTHVDDGKLSGPVVDSPRQLWSVAGYLDMVVEGVFGLENDGKLEPKIPASLVPMLFGRHDRISLLMPAGRVTLLRPAKLDGNLLVAGSTKHAGSETIVMLKAVSVLPAKLRTRAPFYAPATAAAPRVTRAGNRWDVHADVRGRLYVDGKRHGSIDGDASLPWSDVRRCFRVTRVDQDGVESLPSEATCVGPSWPVAGAWPRKWKAPRAGRFRVRMEYANPHGPINTGITVAVKWLRVACAGSVPQEVLLVMPHSDGVQASTGGVFTARSHATCSFSLAQGFNMSDLAHFAHYTGGEGGAQPVNEADYRALRMAPLAGDPGQP